MENLDKLEKLVQQIKSISGYKFKKPIYLLNAFKPRTTQNNFFGNNYEVLEFIGDKAIGIAVVRLLVSYFKLDIDNTKLDDFQSNHPNCFKQSSNEGILTQIEDNLTQEEYLSQCFIKLNLD
ncbi:hypothetical protein J6P59_00490 [bacterium]|nr:hypothetical protein [bacterium]